MIDVRLSHISKKYRIRQKTKNQRTRHPVLRKLQSLFKHTSEFCALSDISFEVHSGEALGIIGHNGAGKSTILKLLSGITTPTAGEIEINGRLSALIEVGSGFHPELTGRENIYLNGSILGMRRREIKEKLDSIVDFAGLSQFIDVPVKRYSSGMYVRLGFSIAAHLEPDILLLDEVLAVGDAEFQAKCIQRIHSLKRAGTTIVFISHDLQSVEGLCDRVLLLDQGKVVAVGTPVNVIAKYQSMSTVISCSLSSELGAGNATKDAEITSVVFYDAGGQETHAFRTGEPITVRIEYTAQEWLYKAVCDVLFNTGNRLQCHLTTQSSDEQIDIRPGTGAIEFYCAELGLRPGGYNVDVKISRRGEIEQVDWKSTVVNVGRGKLTAGAFYMPFGWKLTQDGHNQGHRSSEGSFHINA